MLDLNTLRLLASTRLPSLTLKLPSLELPSLREHQLLNGIWIGLLSLEALMVLAVALRRLAPSGRITRRGRGLVCWGDWVIIEMFTCDLAAGRRVLNATDTTAIPAIQPARALERATREDKGIERN
ncbi:hypothetical protein BT67DRAFT_434643 [Trichocladium antarcticum]|uniref:Uncharacterized protein n=1 Tax=Trichocladium antarcticum TaxID=1450529 RepID=A0AAN6ZDP6_9PEZI|nr:hypothetical protein BT67DRAFT_434643 [Trichocladium antarcticum]